MPSRLSEVVRLCTSKIRHCLDCDPADLCSDQPVLVLLAAGRGTRFGKSPKCVQPVRGKPLARYSIDAFRQCSDSPAICIVGYEADRVCDALGAGNVFVETDDSTGGTALAAMEAFSVQQLEQANPIVVVTMGDRMVPPGIFARLLETHRGDPEAALTMLTAIYEPPAHVGKGRIARDPSGKIKRIVEQRDIDALEPGSRRRRLHQQTEGNCPLYAIRAATLKHYLGNVTQNNAQGQFYFTDIVEAIDADGGTIRWITVDPGDDEYAILCCDLTRAEDLPSLCEAVDHFETSRNRRDADGQWPARTRHAAAKVMTTDRSVGQSLSIAAQLEELRAASRLKELGFDPHQPVGIGVSGGRLRIAFMHPDMGRFFGPAWQMPIGAAVESGRQQIVVMVQAGNDNSIHLYPMQRALRERVNRIPADLACMHPPASVVDGYAYENFGTRMTEQLLEMLGYIPDDEIARLRDQGQSLPDPTCWISNAMRRPFALLGNVIASLRTIRDGQLGDRVQSLLGVGRFRGLKVVSTGEIPQGGFSSSSAFTLAAINALDALFELGLSCDQKVKLACQSEYGTGVRAGALDQATEQKGRHSVGALISSNPKEDYRIIGTYRVPADRFRVHFPYTVDRDSAAWRWSAGVYAPAGDPRRLTAAEIRKMTGKASELAAILVGLPVDLDFFEEIQDDLVETGRLSPSTMLHVRDTLRQIPLRVTRDELRAVLAARLDWYVQQQQLRDPTYGREQAGRTLESLLSGWRDPLLKRTTPAGRVVEERGTPLRAMVGYLYREVAHNCYMIHHPEQWIECVTQSQHGDRCFDIPLGALPSKHEMLGRLSWERDAEGPARMQRWLDRCHATPFDFNRGIDDQSLADPDWCLTRVKGTNFFRGLALIDLAEAMLKRAFGSEAVAVRVNGAGQGDYFQVHVDSQLAEVESVKDFIRRAIYQRFGLNPRQDFVEPHPGGGAVGLRLDRHDELLKLIDSVRRQARQITWKQPQPGVAAV